MPGVVARGVLLFFHGYVDNRDLPSSPARRSSDLGRNKRSALRRFGRRLATNPDDGDKLRRLQPALVRCSAISLAACRKSALIFPNLWPGLLRGGAISYCALRP